MTIDIFDRNITAAGVQADARTIAVAYLNSRNFNSFDANIRPVDDQWTFAYANTSDQMGSGPVLAPQTD